jgi:hypothetical protein
MRGASNVHGVSWSVPSLTAGREKKSRTTWNYKQRFGMVIKGKRHMENNCRDWMILKFTLRKFGVKEGISLKWLWRGTVNTVMKTLLLLRHRHYLICLVIINLSKNSLHPGAPEELLTDRPSVLRAEGILKKTAGSHTRIKKPVRYLNAQTQC